MSFLSVQLSFNILWVRVHDIIDNLFTCSVRSTYFYLCLSLSFCRIALGTSCRVCVDAACRLEYCFLRIELSYNQLQQVQWDLQRLHYISMNSNSTNRRCNDWDSPGPQKPQTNTLNPLIHEYTNSWCYTIIIMFTFEYRLPGLPVILVSKWFFE